VFEQGVLQLAAQPVPSVQRFQFNIAPNAPLKDLLPTPPSIKKLAGPVLGSDLAQVPEVEFQGAPAKKLAGEEAVKDTAYTIAKVNHLNAKKTDGFLKALRGERPDLAGLPFAMGDACRTKGERSRQFTIAVNMVRGALGQAPGALGVGALFTNVAVAGGGPGVPVGNTVVATPAPPAQAGSGANGFWDQFQAACAQQDQEMSRVDRALCEHVTLARIAALLQILAPESPDLRLGLVKYLAGVSHAEATRALARLAIFTPEDEIRQAAVEALKVRRERDYTDVLVQGLRYPWPAVARRAADAAVKLERADLVPQLVDVLDEPDPRAPVLKEVEDQKVPVVREMVRVNHHRSCVLCHAPGNTDKVAPDTLTAPVPVPDQPLPTPSQGYGPTFSPDTLVRVDVTYLRQDFSVRQPVADANPWPEMQRFDFLVRARVLTNEEAEAYRAKLDADEPGGLSPYRRAALAALRELTKKDTEPTAEAWRHLLGLAVQRR
jgi:hypothetical protein